jgi:hypothetical protein
MQQLMPPVCLVLSLALLVTGFALLAIDAPEPNVDLHRARVAGDEAFQAVLERDLTRRIWTRRILIGTLFLAATMLGVGGFRYLGREPRRWGNSS